MIAEVDALGKRKPRPPVNFGKRKPRSPITALIDRHGVPESAARYLYRRFALARGKPLGRRGKPIPLDPESETFLNAAFAALAQGLSPSLAFQEGLKALEAKPANAEPTREISELKEAILALTDEVRKLREALNLAPRRIRVNSPPPR